MYRRPAVGDRGRSFCHAKPKREATFAATYQLWPEPVDGQELFNEVVRRIQNEAVIPPAQLCACLIARHLRSACREEEA